MNDDQFPQYGGLPFLRTIKQDFLFRGREQASNFEKMPRSSLFFTLTSNKEENSRN